MYANEKKKNKVIKIEETETKLMCSGLSKKIKKKINIYKLALRFELRTNRFAIYCATTAPYELCNYLLMYSEFCLSNRVDV